MDMGESPELTRSQSVPVLNRDEAVVKKMLEQDGIISLMQTQIEFQSEVLAKHDKKFEELLLQIKELSNKVKSFEEALSNQSDISTQDAAKSALWMSSGTNPTENKISIADLAKETAEQTLGVESGYVYDEKLGLYFDQNSGYYYDPVKQLFYNGHTQTYYSFDAATNSYHEVHPANESAKRKKNRKYKSSNRKHQKVKSQSPPNSDSRDDASQRKTENDPVVLKDKDQNILLALKNDIDPHSEGDKNSFHEKSPSDMEEGELTSSEPTSAESSPQSNNSKSCDTSDNEDQVFAPAVRAIVQDSLPGLKTGTLFLVPCTGGMIGSSESSSILLPFDGVEKMHAKIEYHTVDPNSTSGDAEVSDQSDIGKYFITDLGSTEGTYLNRSRLSEPETQSEPHELVHGSTIKIGDTTLLIHIHPGDSTCGHCEPGLLIQKDPMYAYTGTTSKSERNSEMKKIKKKYGLDRNPGTTTKSENVYKDRAKDRRVKIGSDNPFAKTEVASTTEPIKESNKGFKMLKKMGWKGESLGSSESGGIKEPINCELKADRGGLGFSSSLPIPTVEKSSSKKSQKLAKTIERFTEADQSSESPKESKELDY